MATPRGDVAKAIRIGQQQAKAALAVRDAAIRKRARALAKPRPARAIKGLAAVSGIEHLSVQRMLFSDD